MVFPPMLVNGEGGWRQGGERESPSVNRLPGHLPDTAEHAARGLFVDAVVGGLPLWWHL